MVIASILITGIVIGTIIFLTRKYIAKYYASNNEEIYLSFVKLLIIYAFTLNSDLLYAYLSTLMRSVNHAIYWTATWVFFVIFCNSITCWYMRNHMEGTQAHHFYLATHLYLNLVALLGIIKLAIFDWTEIQMIDSIVIGSPGSRGSPRQLSPINRISLVIKKMDNT